MAIDRTGPDLARGFAKTGKNFLHIIGLLLELVGQPILWVILSVLFVLLQTSRLVVKLSRVILPLISLFCLGILRLFGLIIFSLLKGSFFFLFIGVSLAKNTLTKLRIKKRVRRLIFWWKKEINQPAKNLVNLSKRAKKQITSIPKQTNAWLVILIAKWKLILFLSLFFLLVAGSLSSYFLILKKLPQPDRLISRNQAVSTKIYDRKGRLLYKIYRNQNRTLVKIEDIPPYLIQATVAIEDAEFYQHYGFSPKGIFRSLVKNLAKGKLQGGSTITQQLVKNALLSSERTLTRKVKELILAVQTEMRFDKEEILQMYLNEVSYGGAAYGAEEAAWKYFNKPVHSLTLAESALLAGLPASPTVYSPFGAHPEKAKQRQTFVLQRMVAEGFISAEEAEKAQAAELQFTPQEANIKAPHFVMYLKELLVKEFGEQLVEEGGLEITTSLDLEIQDLTQKIVREEISSLKRLNVQNGAALVTNPKTGEILAMVGSSNYFDVQNDGNVNVTLRPRQPGSAIKPVNYAVALGMGYTPATILSDTPITYKIPGQPPYSPRNYDNRFHGNIPLRTALASSYNVPAVKVLSSYGVERMIEMGKSLGITTWEDLSRFGLSLTLGGGEVKMIDLAVTYSTLANLGQKQSLNPILKITDYQGTIYQKLECLEQESDFPREPAVEAKETACQQESVLDPKIAYLINHILSDNLARTPAFGPYSLLNLPGKTVAVKTGTTSSLRDNWTIGYTPNLLMAAWVGNNDNSPMSYIASGLTGASSIWNKVMTKLLAAQENQPFPRPEGIIEVEICPLTGTLPCEGCLTKKELFIAGTEPKTHCQLKKEEEREKILSAQDPLPIDKMPEEPAKIKIPKPSPPPVKRPKEGEVIWERIRR